MSDPIEMPGAAWSGQTWRATVSFGADGAPMLLSAPAGYTDTGAGVVHDDAGHYTLTFPACSVVFVEALTLYESTFTIGEAHVHSLDPAAGELHLHTTVNDTQADPSSGSLLWVTLVLA